MTIPMYDTSRGDGKVEVIEFTSDLAHEWRTSYEFPNQRTPKAWWVAALSQMMVQDVFTPTPIHLAHCAEDGGYYLVDGQHRLRAIAESGTSYRLPVIHHECPTFADVADLYGRLDRGAGRSVTDVFKAHDLANALDISAPLMGQMGAALVLIAAQFDPTARRVIARDGDMRIHMLREWRDEVAQYGPLIPSRGSDALTAARMRSAPVASVGLLTMRNQPDKATEFWSALGTGEGLEADEPELALRRWFANTPLRQGDTASALTLRAVVSAWNAAFEGRRVRTLRPSAVGGIPIAGTGLELPVPRRPGRPSGKQRSGATTPEGV